MLVPPVDSLMRPGYPSLRVPFKLALHLTRAQRGSVLVRAGDRLMIQEARRISHHVVLRTRIPVGAGIAGWVAEHREPLLIEHESQLPPGLKLRRRGYRGASLISVPIKLGRTAVGVMNVADHVDGRPFCDDDLDGMLLIARQAADLIRLHQSSSDTRRTANLDPLTGLVNRGYLEHRLPEEIERARRYGYALSLLTIDLDHFRSADGGSGHLIGDIAVKVAADVLRSVLRAADTPARSDGNELLALLPHTDARQAMWPARRFLEHLRAVSLPPPLRGQIAGLGASIGVSAAPVDADVGPQLLERSRQAVHLAKAMRSDVEAWHPALLPLGVRPEVPLLAPPAGARARPKPLRAPPNGAAPGAAQPV